MRIVSLNAWGGRCWPALDRWLAVERPDVVCLQEVTRAPLRAPPWLKYQDAFRELDQRADLFGDVSKALPMHQPWFAAAARGPLTDSNGRAWMSEHGIACWVAPHLAVTERIQGFVHGRFRRDGWGEEPVPRTMQVMRVEDPTTGASLVIGHFHGLREPEGKGDTPARQRQAVRARALVEGLAGQGEGVVLGGDFNLLPGSETFEILAEAGLYDLVQAGGIEDTRTELYDKPVRHANYVLVNDAVDLRGFEVPAAPVVSDHRPLILEVGMEA
ncbi:endonuclease/exonuclease/phosphatase family protein [Jannaschia seohaensis]|uniref:Endonuclease/exonuclease/phosphatase family metal-dependent hydrolase n=1 Tax=Jannaschia seohaensis TaxID=475081 RepID=A0A2Y9A5T5_9RHOB|nr:endonuclease/exonuclease/phosphatase family protein [Jannaschia seohaensis]PWJ22540.1 endonuclease/exonuclease/phosphatase family metal-dependent hydrolase [Jannaschia seohaensis]SSA38818.1 Metal-dependent hydrolase, endonuclease/exonuclease/phosphatase family [Jannaschia seohaensis]